MKEVVVYCRVACAKESDPRGVVRLQEQAVRRYYAEACRLSIRETYLDAGVSSGTLERPALQRLLANCRAGKICTVITQDLHLHGWAISALGGRVTHFLFMGVDVS